MWDYLDNLYPTVPIVHRPSFQKALQDDHDYEDDGFLSLTTSIVALVVATMASKFQAYQSHDPPLKFSSRKEVVHFCYAKVTRLRTSSYFDELNFQKFSVPYLFFAAFLQLGDHNWSRMLSVEAMQIARLLNFHQISEYKGLNCIETQLRKKGFWLVFYSFVHAHLQNLLGERLTYLDPVMLHAINPSDLLPLETDDECIFEHEAMIPENTPPCLATGFIYHSRVFWAAIRSSHPNVPEDEPCSCVRARNPNLQVSYYQNRLDDLQSLVGDIPTSLWVPASDEFNHEDPNIETANNIRTQFASLRANLHVTHLWLQSLIMDQLEVAQSNQRPSSGSDSGHQPATLDQRTLWMERERLCRELFFIIFNTPQISLEANGLHLANKVRDIAASLLACPFLPDDPVSKRVSDYIQRATDILSRLDSSEGMNTMHLQTWVDTDRIRT
ncbi:hypothetical protein N7448_006093 [Penicillium atrosanguineum]|nr:hypothetical protein N7448_006093 [Penicillium atrosanguineum]